MIRLLGTGRLSRHPVRRAGRFLAMLLAGLQLALPAAVSLADAQLDAQSYSSAARSHVEEQSSTMCPRIHALDCALCQFLSSAVGAPTAQVLQFSSRRADPCPTEAGIHRVAAAGEALPQSRAPPLS